jgi:hypothetical protein
MSDGADKDARRSEWKRGSHLKIRAYGRSAVRSIVFHEKAFKLEMKFISLLCYKVGGGRLGSGFHADSLIGPCLDPSYRKRVERCHLVIGVSQSVAFMRCSAIVPDRRSSCSPFRQAPGKGW